MGTMTKIRENTGVILWILVFAFGVIWVLQDSGGFDVIGANPGQVIISVNGDPISYEEYNRALDAQVESYRQQTGEAIPPQRLDLEHERVYNSLVDNKLREQEMDRLGITVTDPEVLELVMGNDPHPLIKAYFSDGQGGVDQALLQNFIDDPTASEQWLALEEYLRVDRRQQKLNSLISATVRVSDADILDAYNKRNTRYNARYFSLRYADIRNDSIEVTDQDLRKYYNENKEDYKREKTFTVRYAFVRKDATPEDTLATIEDVEKLRNAFETADDDSLFLVRYGSERPYSSAFFNRSDLEDHLSGELFDDPEPGKIIGPVVDVDGTHVHMMKILEVRPAEETVIKARHILVRPSDQSDSQKQAARSRSQELKRRLQAGEDFAELARAESDDRASGEEGGDLGWFGDGKMVKEFQDAAFAARVGQLVGPIESEFGYHLIEVQDRAQDEIRLADFAQTIRASNATLTQAEERLEDLQYYASETGSFESEAERMGFALEEVQAEADQQFVPGIGNSRALMNFLATSDVGDISEVIELDASYIVATIAEIIPEGYSPQDEVENAVRTRAILEKKKDRQRELLESAYQQGGFDGLAEALGTTSRLASNLAFNNPTVSGLGREPAFIGTVMGLEVGEDSGVIAGNNSVFVVQLESVDVPMEMSDEERLTTRESLLNRRRSRVQSQWITSLREQADIEDQRSAILQ